MKSFRELRFEPNPLDAPCVALARVMSPAEVQNSTRDQSREARNALAGRWMVCGDMAGDVFDRVTAMAHAELPWRLSGFTSTKGVHYAVIAHQLDDYQHRFMLPAWSAPARDFIKAVGAGEGYGFMFGRDGGEAAFVLFGQASREMFGSLRRYFVANDEDSLQRGIAELPRALWTLGQRGAIPSVVPGHDVKCVSVSVATPPLSISRAEPAH